MSITKAFENGFKRMEERGWEQIYVFVDIHSTVLYPDYIGSIYLFLSRRNT